MAIVRWFIGVGLAAALLWTVDLVVGWRSIWESLGSAPLAVVLQCGGLFALSHLLRAWRIHFFKAASLGVGFGLTLKLSLLHQSFNNLLPMRLGEASYPLLMRRYADISLVDATMDLIWLRLLDLLVMAGIAILFLLGFVNGSLAMLVAALFMLTGCFLLAMVAGKNTWQTESDEPSGFIRSGLRAFSQRGPSSGASVWLLFTATATAWALKIFALLLFAAVTSDLHWLTVWGGVIAGEASSLLPVHGIAGAGTYEAAFVAGAYVGGESLEQMLLTAVNLHIFIVSSTCLLTLLVLPLGRERSQQEKMS